MSAESPRKQLLFVDDEPGIRATLPLALRAYGYNVTVADTAAKAIQLIEAQQFDVLVTDLNIDTNGDGYAIVDAVRQIDRRCVVIVLTGYPDLETALNGIHHGIDEYLVKPAGAETLATAIAERLLARKPKARILSVSYDMPLLRTRNMLLEREGYEVVSTSTLKASLEYCRDGGFDAFIIGHSIPHEHQQKLADEFRKHSTAPVISLRRSAGEQLVRGADHMIEPDPEPLLKLVAQIARKKSQGARAELHGGTHA